MIFGFKSNRRANDKGSLTEGAIRSRLYGGAVAISDDVNNKSNFDEFSKKTEPKKRIVVEDTLNEEQLRLLRDLRALHNELEQTKRRLKKMHSLKKRTAMFLFLRFVTFVVISAVLFLAFNKFFMNREPNHSKPKTTFTNIKTVQNIDLILGEEKVVTPPKVVKPTKPAALPVVEKTVIANYTIQVAVYAGRADAERFKQGMIAKGYEVFIRKSVYKTSGKPKYIVCVGTFANKEEASNILDKLREEDKITDSFILSMNND